MVSWLTVEGILLIFRPLRSLESGYVYLLRSAIMVDVFRIK